MPQPGISDVHQNAVMTQLSIAYKNPRYIADQVLPGIKVAKQADDYYIFTKGDWFRDEADLRAPGTRAKRGGYTLDTDEYSCKEYAFAKELPDEVRENADAVLNPEIEATEFATDRVMLKIERELAAAIFVAGVWANDKTGGTDFTVWSDYDNCDPIGDVDGWKDTIHKSTGMEPNRLLIGREVWSKLKRAPDILELVKYVERGILTEDLVAQVLGVEKIIVGDPIYNSAAEGVTVVQAYIWGKYALLYYVPDRPALRTPSAGYILNWHERSVRNWREAPEKQDVFEASQNLAIEVTGTDLGLLAASVVA